MATIHASAATIGELVRTRTAVGQLVEVELSPLDSGSRARGSARFALDVRMPWLTAHAMRAVTPAGKVDSVTWAGASLWLVKNLPGIACGISVRLNDAASLPARWTPARVFAKRKKIDATDADAIRAEAISKALTVRDWADSARRSETLAAATAMLEAAALLRIVQGTSTVWPVPDAPIPYPPPPPPPPAPPPGP